MDLSIIGGFNSLHAGYFWHVSWLLILLKTIFLSPIGNFYTIRLSKNLLF